MEYIAINLIDRNHAEMVIKMLLSLNHVFTYESFDFKRSNDFNQIISFIHFDFSCSLLLGKYPCMKEWRVRERHFIDDNTFKVVDVDTFISNYQNLELPVYKNKYITPFLACTVIINTPLNAILI